MKDVRATYTLAGTAAYLSPEGQRKEPADIFALGKVLYEMLTGYGADEFPRPPDLGSLSEKERSVLNEVNAVLLKACDDDPRKRHGCASELREELELLKANRSVLSLRDHERLRRRFRQVVVTLAGAVAVLALGYLIGGFFVFKNRAAEQNRQRELRGLRISRMQLPTDDWFSNDWARLERPRRCAPTAKCWNRARRCLRAGMLAW